MKKDSLPPIIDEAKLAEMNLDHIKDGDEREHLSRWAKKMASGRPFFEGNQKYRDIDVNNVWLSRCYNCDEVAVWILSQMVFPQKGEAPPANQDLPPEIARDYDEASSILDLSPRGAAALIRLAIQKLCKHLGQPGDNINADIKALVAGGAGPSRSKGTRCCARRRKQRSPSWSNGYSGRPGNCREFIQTPQSNC